MKRRQIAITTTIAGLLSLYVASYYKLVLPLGNPKISAGKIPLISGWGPYYNCCVADKLDIIENNSWDPQGLLNIFFKPIHMIDQSLRPEVWLTPEEKQREIYQASQPRIPFTYDMAIVRVLNEPINSPWDKNYPGLLSFRDGLRYHSFKNCTTVNWKEKYSDISEILLSKAKSLSLDTNSLRQALGLILKHSGGEIPYLPVSVHQAEFNHRPVWIIKVRWGHISNEQVYSFTHVRVFVYDQQTLELLKYSTCVG